MRAMLKREQVILYLAVGVLSVFAVVDLFEDINAGEPFLQIFAEGLVFALAIFGIATLIRKNLKLKTQITNVKGEKDELGAEAKKWKEDHETLIKGLRHAIDKQLNAWNLSSSEAEIALLLLKGLSFKEISEIRGTSEKTVRQQSVKVYEKSGLAGRSELSAFFLEDIL